MNYPLSLIAGILLTFLSSVVPANAQAGMVRKGVAELIEYFTKSGAKQSAKEFAEIGGEQLVQEVLEKAAKEGGDELVGQIVSLCKRGGPRTLQALGSDPARMTNALRGLPESQLADSVIETSRNPELMAKLVRSQGDKVVVAAARHPGIGTQVIDEFGDAGLNAARKLDTDGMLALAKTKGFRQLPEPAKRKFTSLLNRHPREVSNALKLAAGGAGIVLTVDFINRLEREIFGKAGSPGRLTRAMVAYGWLAGGILITALAAYFTIKLRGVWRSTA